MSIPATTQQQSRIDSMKKLLNNANNDTIRVLQLTSLARIYLYSRPDTTLLLCSQGLVISQQLKFTAGEARCLEGMADAYDNLGNYPNALENYFSTLRIYERIHDTKGIRRC